MPLVALAITPEAAEQGADAVAQRMIRFGRTVGPMVAAWDAGGAALAPYLPRELAESNTAMVGVFARYGDMARGLLSGRFALVPVVLQGAEWGQHAGRQDWAVVDASAELGALPLLALAAGTVVAGAAVYVAHLWLSTDADEAAAERLAAETEREAMAAARELQRQDPQAAARVMQAIMAARQAATSPLPGGPLFSWIPQLGQALGATVKQATGGMGSMLPLLLLVLFMGRRDRK